MSATLFNPDVAGRPRAPTVEGDNDALVRNTELKLQCTCGCTLDIFTCRTTDFTCTYSPALHREVVALFAEGKTSEQVIAAFVDKYGEKILMAPEAGGLQHRGVRGARRRHPHRGWHRGLDHPAARAAVGRTRSRAGPCAACLPPRPERMPNWND